MCTMSNTHIRQRLNACMAGARLRAQNNENRIRKIKREIERKIYCTLIERYLCGNRGRDVCHGAALQIRSGSNDNNLCN